MLLSAWRTPRGSRNSCAVEGTAPGSARLRFLMHFLDFHSCEICDTGGSFHHRKWQVGQKHESRTVSYSDLKTFPFQFMRWVCTSFPETSLLLKSRSTYGQMHFWWKNRKIETGKTTARSVPHSLNDSNFRVTLVANFPWTSFKTLTDLTWQQHWIKVN